jgi:D-beta-D-heptose 7-phosphate kinase/D-beta-D-heptose 1-phosphate adenosyltransferase
MIVSSIDELSAIVARRQRAGEKLVFTNGVFDLVHVGHLRYLAEARSLGDGLIVAVNSDSSVRRIKGPLRPLIAEDERAELLDSLKSVDYVVLFDTDTPVPVVAAVKPAIYVKGGDYTVEALPETPIVKAYGGEVKILGFTPGRSSTNLLQTIVERYGEHAEGSPSHPSRTPKS